MQLKNLCFIVPLLACLSSNPCHAAIILSVDMDSLTPAIESSRDLTPAQQFTANIVMSLTESSTLSAYQFSIEYDRNELLFVSRTETAPPGFGFFETDPSNPHDIANARLKFFGADTGVGPVAPAGPFVVATVTFDVLAPIGGPADFDISVGKFDVGDDFLENGTFLPIPDNQLIFNGGAVTNAVPEPSSMLLLGGAAAALGCRRNRKRTA